MGIDGILDKPELGRDDVIALLECRGRDEELLFARSKAVRDRERRPEVHMRGLIEISNICTKDCLYCGIRRSNAKTGRYALTDREILDAAAYAWKEGYGSVVLQGGERQDAPFVERIGRLVREIKSLSGNGLGITLSLGEQSEETYRSWFQAGAHRYLLRIESSRPELFGRIHPDDGHHRYEERLECLRRLQRCGYQTGSGVMIGLPFQTTGDLADDLLFLKGMDIDMVGMGPYLEHRDTPLWNFRHLLLPQRERLRLGLHMVSVLRLLMPDINIAATTALQAIDPEGREMAIAIGANVIMPNITPLGNRADYRLYENKPGMDEGTDTSLQKLLRSVRKTGCEIRMEDWGDSPHFYRRH